VNYEYYLSAYFRIKLIATHRMNRQVNVLSLMTQSTLSCILIVLIRYILYSRIKPRRHVLIKPSIQIKNSRPYELSLVYRLSVTYRWILVIIQNGKIEPEYRAGRKFKVVAVAKARERRP